jgi:Fe-S cluster assembly protein SufD
MTIDTISTGFGQDYLKQYSTDLGEPKWLQDTRLQALAQANELPMPKPDKTKIDKWNFTSFKTHTVESNQIHSLDELPEVVKSLIHNEEANHNLYIQRDNTPAYLSLSEDLKAKGVIFTDIHTAAREHSALLQQYFMKDGVKVDEHRLTALHAAFFNGGVFVYVPKNVEVKEPLQAIYINENPSCALFNHVIVVADESSSVSFVENYLSVNDVNEGIYNIITEVFVNDNANVFFAAVDNLAKGITTYVNRRAIALQDGRMEWALGLMNDGNTISDNATYLVGNGSFGDAKTVVVSRGNQIQNFTTNITHFGLNSVGNILSHGVVKDSSTAIFNGIGKIEHGATKSNAEQESRVLMLSEKARGDANPMLLIDEDDVFAGHAASIGRVDQLQLYYLMSRGITKAEAERLIVFGFLAPVVNKIPIEGVKKQLTEVIERKVQ